MRGKNILVDSELGNHIGSNAGLLTKGLAAINLLPEDIHEIIITHSHLDHIGGLVKNNRKVFPHATYFMSELEYSFLKKYGNSEEIEVISVVEQDLKFIEAEGIICEGIQANYYPGHTQGNIVIEINLEGKSLFIAGDIFNIPSSIEDPTGYIKREFSIRSGLDSRKRLIKESIENNALVQVYHFPFPGLGRMAKEENRYVWDSSRYQINKC